MKRLYSTWSQPPPKILASLLVKSNMRRGHGVDAMIAVYTDGRAEPNPGLGTYGLVVYEDGRRTHSAHGLAGHGVTNNYAEYFCLIKALEHLSKRRDEEIKVFSDSNLLVNQMKGEWKFKGGAYAEKYIEAKELAKGFSRLRFEWIPREKNSEADELTNLAFAQAKPG